MSQGSSSGLAGDSTGDHDGIAAGFHITARACSDPGKRVRVWRLWFLFFMHFKAALKKRRVASSRYCRAQDFPLEDAEDCGADDGGDTLSASFEIRTGACSASGKSFWSSQLRLRLRFIGHLAARQSKAYHVIDVGSDDEEGEVGYDEHLLRRIVKEKDLDLLRKFGGVEKVSLLLDSRSEATVDPDSTDCPAYLHSNIIRRKGFGHFLFKSISSFTIISLLLAAVLSFPVDMTVEGAKYGWHDGVAILVAVFLLVAFSSVTNFNQEIKMEKKLLKVENEMEVQVEREGKSVMVSISDVVVGDRVKLREGDRVPADGLFLRSEDLAADDVLNPEIDDVLNPEIDYEKNPFLLAGSKVTKGHCWMIVVSVGADTALGDRLSSVVIHPTEKPLLQSRLDKPYLFIDKIALLVSILIALVVLVRLLFRKHGSHFDMPEIKGDTKLSRMLSIFGKLLLNSQGRVSILINVLAAVVIGIQHGLPFVITISLSFWKEKFVSNHGNPQNLSACGTVGLISAICFDITGALLCNQIAVSEFWIGEKDVKVDTEERIDQGLLEILAQAMIVSGPEPKTYQAVISFAKSQWDMNVELLDRNLSSTNNGVRKTEDGEQKHCKGAASTILEKCSHYYDAGGEVRAMEDQKSTFERVIRTMEINGLRSIAFASKEAKVQELKEDNMHLLALVGLKLCQEETKKTLENFRDAGLRIILVSEDELVRAKVIASELGIFQCTSDNLAIEGAELETLANGAIAEKLTVMGNSLPKQKLLLVEKLQEEGEVVAFLGGMSASDVPALKTADVGIVGDNKSIEIAKIASDIIVKDVASLTQVQIYGKNVYANIQTFYQLQLTGSLSGLFIALFSTISSGGSPITGIHIIWVNLIGSLLGCLMMTMELRKGNETQVSQEGKRNQQLITKVIWTKIAIQVLYQASAVLMIEYLGKHLSGMNEDVRQSVVLNTFTLCQIFNLLNAMEITKREVFMVVLSNWWFLLALGAVPVIQAMLLPYTESFTGCARLSAEKWAFCIFVAALPWRFKWLVYIFSFIPSIHLPLILGR